MHYTRPFTTNRRLALLAGAASLLLPKLGLASTVLDSARGPLTGPVLSPDSDAPDAPAVQISNGLVTAVLYLPDATRGYYRGTRFDWSGLVASLHTRGHSYFGRWFAEYDPRKHDAVAGPAQDWVTGQGFDTAEAGGTFVKIGVGVLRKPAEAIRGFPTLEIVDHGTWTTNVSPDAVEFIHEVHDPASGYGYRHTKIVRLPPGEMQLVMDQRIECTGANPIDAQMYNHNFFVLDQQPSGPDTFVTFPFTLEPFNMRGDAVQVNGNTLNYVKAVDGSVRMQLRGFSQSPHDYTIRVENRRTGAGVLVTSDTPMSDLVFWSNPRTTCPEAYIHVRAEPGGAMAWQTTYQFYGFTPGNQARA